MKKTIVSCVIVAIAAFLAGCGGSEDESASPPTVATSQVPFDRAFIDAMVPHHEGAIEMARAAKQQGLSVPELQTIAELILINQQEEIDQMRAWRQEWYGSSAIDPNGAAVLGLSVEEMGMQHDADALTSSGDIDAAFASMMIDHHRGAIRMAELALTRAQHDEVRELAETIIRDQSDEIDTLSRHASGDHH